MGTPSFSRGGHRNFEAMRYEATEEEEARLAAVCIQPPAHHHPPGDTHTDKRRHGTDF